MSLKNGDHKTRRERSERERPTRKGNGRSRPLDPLNRASPGEILRHLRVSDWDALIIGDGSGSDWQRGCGWCSVLHDRMTGLRKYFHGAMNNGTCNMAELMAYVHALLWYAGGPGRTHLHKIIASRPGTGLKVHVVTDSDILVKQGMGQASRKKLKALWAAVDVLTYDGYDITWHWLRRNTLQLNQLSDLLSRRSREAVTALGDIRLPQGTTVYDYNQCKAVVSNGDGIRPIQADGFD